MHDFQFFCAHNSCPTGSAGSDLVPFFCILVSELVHSVDHLNEFMICLLFSIFSSGCSQVCGKISNYKHLGFVIQKKQRNECCAQDTNAEYPRTPFWSRIKALFKAIHSLNRSLGRSSIDEARKHRLCE
jgi:hypothetical protein